MESDQGTDESGWGSSLCPKNRRRHFQVSAKLNDGPKQNQKLQVKPPYGQQKSTVTNKPQVHQIVQVATSLHVDQVRHNTGVWVQMFV